ncbi:S8 family peptidase [Saccharothrix texasensis]|uniref:Subtilisin family serine protease n=1 Tax=Saccharothrix texasensis TaxID=103734 RepID=A0A3N1H310_9PSEU|nr:S8 family peptidase [Saccharothrix texasensis]ROP36880.1 subtilisin family serine protease [Saccharothrix texasensis]
MRTLLSGLGVAALAAVTLTAPAQAEGAVLHAGSATAVPGSYIVKLADTAAAGAVAARLDGRVSREFPSLHGFAATLTAKQARRLAADPAVAYVEQDQVVRAHNTQPNAPFGLDRIDQRALPVDGGYSYTSTGLRTRAYVIDTGIRTTHAEFSGRTCPGYDVIDNDTVPQDDNGHGTAVASLIAGSVNGVAKQAAVCGVRVLNGSGSGTTAGVLAGIDWVARNHVKPASANLSLGGGASTALDDAVRRLIAAGVTASVTAGGSNADAANFSPARVREALTSGATTRTDTRATFSNYGSVVDVYAPGVSVTVAWNSGDTATNTLSGTSLSTAYVTGVTLRFLQLNPTATPAQVHSAVVSEATPLSWGRLLYWSPVR